MSFTRWGSHTGNAYSSRGLTEMVYNILSVLHRFSIMIKVVVEHAHVFLGPGVELETWLPHNRLEDIMTPRYYRTGLFSEVDHQPPGFEYMLAPVSLTKKRFALFDVEFKIMIWHPLDKWVNIALQVMEMRQALNHLVEENIICKRWQAATSQRDLSKSININLKNEGTQYRALWHTWYAINRGRIGTRATNLLLPTAQITGDPGDQVTRWDGISGLDSLEISLAWGTVSRLFADQRIQPALQLHHSDWYASHAQLRGWLLSWICQVGSSAAGQRYGFKLAQLLNYLSFKHFTDDRQKWNRTIVPWIGCITLFVNRNDQGCFPVTRDCAIGDWQITEKCYQWCNCHGCAFEH